MSSWATPKSGFGSLAITFFKPKKVSRCYGLLQDLQMTCYGMQLIFHYLNSGTEGQVRGSAW